MLRDYQQDAINQIRENYSKGIKKVLLKMPTGSGKCMAENTPVLMFDGKIKMSQDVRKGDLLMGPDSKHRKVLSTCSGKEEMIEAKPVKGDSHVFNKSHILSLRSSYKNAGFRAGDIIDISINDYLAKGKTFKHQFKWWRTGVEFKAKSTELDPYFVGLFLAEGTNRLSDITNPDIEIEEYLKKFCNDNGLSFKKKGIRIFFKSNSRKQGTNIVRKISKEMTASDNRFIPDRFKINSRENRLKLLAGLLDGDGYMHHGYFEIITKYDQLSKDILFLARSLGFAAYRKDKFVKLDGWTEKRKYNRIAISGHVNKIPTIIKRKQAAPRKQIKNVLNTGFSLSSKGIGKYYGFEISGDGRYLLGDFSVTHNTHCFNYMFKEVDAKSKKGIMVVHGRKLVDQASERLHRDGVHHGVIMANHKQYRPSANIQICSIDTLYARKIIPSADLVVIDEAHMGTSDGYHWLANSYGPETFFLPVTATPYTAKSLRHIADAVVNPINTIQLMASGNLVAPRYIGARNIPILSGVKLSKGVNGLDYNSNQLGTLLNNNELMGDIVSHWVKWGEGRPTVCFAASVAHSRGIVDAFNAAGIPARHIDAKTPEEVRKQVQSDLESGKIKIVSNVAIWTTGVDIPPLGCIIFARPTLSYSLYIQMAGRGTRPFKGKDDFLILDHAGNVMRHGYITNEVDVNLDGTEVKKECIPRCTQCPNCLTIFEGNECHACGFMKKIDERVREIMTVDGQLVEIMSKTPEMIALDRIKDLKKIKRDRGYKRGWIYYQLVNEFGPEMAEKLMPKRTVPEWIRTNKTIF